MNQNTSYYQRLSGAAFLILILLIILQSIWLKNAVKLRQEQVQLRLEQVVPEIALEINSIGQEYFHGENPSLDEVDIKQMEETVQTYLTEKQITHPTYFAIYNSSDTSSFISNNTQYKDQLVHSEVKSCLSCIVSFSVIKDKDAKQKASESKIEYAERLFENSTFEYFSPVRRLEEKEKDIIWLSLYQPNTYTNALWSLIFLFGANILLLIVLLLLFRYLLKLLANYTALTKLKEDFFNNMTHEFKTPLSSIRLASRVLRQNKNPEKSANYYDLIERESKALELQIDKLLELSLIDGNEVILEKTPVDIHALIRNIPGKMEPLIESHNAEFIFDLQLKDSTISGDPYHLLNSLCNLVENSLKYSEDNVTIWIRTSEEANGRKVISIKDNGPGIKPEYRSHIFDRFYRAKQTNEYKTQGFGIGLSYVKNIIEAHGGILFLNAKYNMGCEFIIKL